MYLLGDWLYTTFICVDYLHDEWHIVSSFHYLKKNRFVFVCINYYKIWCIKKTLVFLCWYIKWRTDNDSWGHKGYWKGRPYRTWYPVVTKNQFWHSCFGLLNWISHVKGLKQGFILTLLFPVFDFWFWSLCSSDGTTNCW